MLLQAIINRVNIWLNFRNFIDIILLSFLYLPDSKSHNLIVWTIIQFSMKSMKVMMIWNSKYSEFFLTDLNSFSRNIFQDLCHLLCCGALFPLFWWESKALSSSKTINNGHIIIYNNRFWKILNHYFSEILNDLYIEMCIYIDINNDFINLWRCNTLRLNMFNLSLSYDCDDSTHNHILKINLYWSLGSIVGHIWFDMIFEGILSNWKLSSK